MRVEALSLFVLGVLLAVHVAHLAASHDVAVLAIGFDGAAHFHPKLSRYVGYGGRLL